MFDIQLVRTIAATTGILASLLMPGVSTIAYADSTSSLKYEVFASPENQFGTNSVILYGGEDAVLFDTTFTKSSAEELAEKIKKLDRKLTAIYLTHGHPDHAASASRILDFFPGVKIYASPGVRGELERDFYSKLVRWQIDFPNDLSHELPPIYPLEGKIFLEGQEIQWLDVVGGESWDATAFYVPSIKTLIAGDLIFNKMHLYQADVYRPQMWIDILDSLTPTFGDIEILIPGHGEVGDVSLIDLNRRYLEEFISVATLPFPDLVKVHDHMVKVFPDWTWPMILHMTRGPAITYPEIMQLYAPKPAEVTQNK
jgi:glyoxylase-like metal-dependent hydrolase (beta-lactamase superfamily II)